MIDFDLYDLEFLAVRFSPNPLGDEFLDTRYNWQRATNHVECPYYRFFFFLAAALKPLLTVELGGWRGTAASHFAAGYPRGKVFTIDHHSDPGDDKHKYSMELANQRYDNLTYLRGWTCPAIAERERGKHQEDIGTAYFDVEKEVGPDQGIDILFIDSWHTYENAMLDWKAYSPLLSSPSLVICDDVRSEENQGDPVSGMLRFWRALPEPKFLNANLHPGTQMGFLKVGNGKD